MPKEKHKKTKGIPEPWINYLLIKLFNSNNLIQTFPLYLLYLIFFYSIFPFLSTLHYIPKEVITKSGYQPIEPALGVSENKLDQV